MYVCACCAMLCRAVLCCACCLSVHQNELFWNAGETAMASSKRGRERILPMMKVTTGSDKYCSCQHCRPFRVSPIFQAHLPPQYICASSPAPRKKSPRFSSSDIGRCPYVWVCMLTNDDLHKAISLSKIVGHNRQCSFWVQTCF